MKNKKYRSIKGQLSAKLGFSFVELIIVIAVIALISVIGMSINNNYTEKTKNSKISSDIKTIQNSLESYKNETKTLPLPKGNQKYFDDSSNYVHYDDTTAYGVYGNITEDTIPKKYMNYTPIDPRTNQYYAYGKTLNGDLAFEISGVNKDNNRFESVVIGDYVGENGPYNLIREYNGPDFVYDQSKNNFPYNPEERVVKAKLGSFSGIVKVNGSDIDKNWIDNNELVSGDVIEVIMGGKAEIYYSDGSKSYLGDEWKDSKLVLANMKYKGENNLFTKIQLALDYGSIWSKTSRLDSSSDFEIYTTDTEAAVRGTIFGVEKNYASSDTFVKVIKGKVEVFKLNGLTFGTLTSDLESETTIPTVNFNISMTSVSSAIVNTNENLHMYGGGAYTGSIYLPPNFSIPNEDGLENIKPKITSINSGKVTLEFPTSFSGTSNGKRVYTGSTALPNPSPHYTFSGNTLTLSGTIAGDVYILKICDSQGIKCTQEISINKDLSYNATTGTGCIGDEILFSGDYDGCVDQDDNLVASGFHLVAYVPYNTLGSYDMYYNTGADTIANMRSFTTSNFIDLGGIKGINLLTGTTDTDRIYYSLTGLGLGTNPTNLAIEMNVRTHTASGATRFLYQVDNYSLSLDTFGYLKLSNTSTISYKDFNSYYNGIFHKIITMKNTTNYTIMSDGIIIGTGSNLNSINTTSPYLYIGSNNSGSPKWYQYNNLIDYIKIYTK